MSTFSDLVWASLWSTPSQKRHSDQRPVKSDQNKSSPFWPQVRILSVAIQNLETTNTFPTFLTFLFLHLALSKLAPNWSLSWTAIKIWGFFRQECLHPCQVDGSGRSLEVSWKKLQIINICDQMKRWVGKSWKIVTNYKYLWQNAEVGEFRVEGGRERRASQSLSPSLTDSLTRWDQKLFNI